MEEKAEQKIETTEAKTDNSNDTAITITNTVDLNKESLTLINQIIGESDIAKQKDLTYLFNINQNKKTMIRVNKLNDLLDTITEQALIRFRTKPDEISNSELLTAMKTTQEMIERGVTQVTGVSENTPMITVNQQNNEIHLDGEKAKAFSRESREKVKNAVLKLLENLKESEDSNSAYIEADIIDNPDVVEAKSEDKNNG